MNKKYIILALLLSIMNINAISASCTQDEIKEFKKVESKYMIKKEFDSVTKTYTLYFHNEYPDNYFYRIYSEQTLECSAYNENSMKCINFQPGSYDIEIMSLSDTCDDILKTITLELSQYNKYSDDALCEGIEEFVLCSPTYSKEIDYRTFVSRVETYKKTKSKKESQIQPVEEEKNTFLELVLNYVKTNIIQIIVVAVFIVLLTITIVITVKSIRESRRLE